MDFISTVLPVIAIVLFVAVFAIVLIIQLRQDRQRTEALQKIASEMGFTFSKDGGAGMAEIGSTANFELFRRGRSHRLANLIHGRREDFEIQVFDYTYVTGGGRNSTTHRQTVTVIALDGPELAVFTLRPESIFDKVASKFGREDINFENRPDFSKKYHLTGDDEVVVRRLFSDPVIDFCAGQRNLNLESTADRLMMLYPGWRPKPEEIRSFMDNAVNLLALLRRPTAAGWGDLYDFGRPAKG